MPGSVAQFNLGFWAGDTALAALAQRASGSDRSAELAYVLSIALGGAFDITVPRAERERMLRELTVLAAIVSSPLPRKTAGSGCRALSASGRAVRAAVGR